MNDWRPARMDFPPINELIEVRLKTGAIPFKAKVKYISKDVVVFGGGDGDFPGETENYEFRLIQTEKDEAIQELSARLYQIHWAGIPSPEDMAETVWDLGYRKRMSRKEAINTVGKFFEGDMKGDVSELIVDALGFKEGDK